MTKIILFQFWNVFCKSATTSATAIAGTSTTPASNRREASINTDTERMPTKVVTRRHDKRRNASNGINASKSREASNSRDDQ
jgi:hypothetical protein